MLPGPPSGWRRWPVQVAVAIVVFVNAVTFWEARGGALPSNIAVVEAGLEPSATLERLRPVRGDDHDAA